MGGMMQSGTLSRLTQYSLLPGIWPRLKELVGSGFATIAGLLAVLYYNVGLLPREHPYLLPVNHGRFGIRHVVIEARRHLVFSRDNIDKIILFFVILCGLVLLLLQFVLLFMSMMAMPAFAATFVGYFTPSTVAPYTTAQDLAFIMLDNVFGVRLGSQTADVGGFFGSCVGDPAVTCVDMNGQNATGLNYSIYPRPFHLAMHQLFWFYTAGIAFVAGIMLIYLVIAVVAETVTSGTPFGQRFNKAWVIPRLIVFFALIAPISTSGNNAGISVGQYLTLAVAKAGSNFATNAWINFMVDSQVSRAVMSGNQRMVAQPNAPSIASLTQFMHVVRGCMYAEKIIHGRDVFPYIVRAPSTDTSTIEDHTGASSPRNAMGGTTNDYLPFYDLVSSTATGSLDFERAVIFSRYNNVVLRFGHRDPPGGSITDLNDPLGASSEWGHVEPTCGEIQFDVTSTEPMALAPLPSGSNFVDSIMTFASSTPNVGMQSVYFNIVSQYLNNDQIIDVTAFCMVAAILPYSHRNACVERGYSGNNFTGSVPYSSDTQWLTIEGARANIAMYDAIVDTVLTGRLHISGSSSEPFTRTVSQNITINGRTATHEVTYPINIVSAAELNGSAQATFGADFQRILQRGWVGASLWYNGIADANGKVAEAVQNMPRPYKYPMVMEQIAAEHRAYGFDPVYSDRFNPRLADGQMANLERQGDHHIAAALYSIFQFWNESSATESVMTREENNAVSDTINALLGINGLYDIVENNDTHPLALLSSLGKSMVDAALNNILWGSLGQGAAQFLGDNFVGRIAGALSQGMAFKFGMIGLSIGFMLYYVLPVLPFIYFFFAFSGWVKSIFEAIVAIPLWALAHIKIDGEGLPGRSGVNGYFLLLEIFLRPIMIVVGFIAGVIIFIALVAILHDIFGLVVMNVSGFDLQEAMRNPQYITSDMNEQSLMAGPVDELFFTAMYTIILYVVGLSCFKMVDAVPNSILRWMNFMISTFQENAGDPASQLSGRMYRGARTTSGQISSLMDRNSSALTTEQLASM